MINDHWFSVNVCDCSEILERMQVSGSLCRFSGDLSTKKRAESV